MTKTPATKQDALLSWLREKLARAEKELRGREEGAKVWAGGSEKDWGKAALLCGGDGRVIPKAQRLELAETQKRIAVKCHRDVDMLKQLIETLSP